jgi:plastocyanin
MNSRSSFLAIIFLAASACGSQPAEPQFSTSGASGAAATTGQLVGQLKGVAGSADAVAVLAPAEPREFTPSDVPAIMNQTGYEFIPHMLVAQVGQTVRFLNSEDVLHNVRVTEVETDTAAFNVSTAAYGSYDHTFERPGFYTVTCDIHTTMRATILITETPYTTRADGNGRFTIHDVQLGAYTLTVYAEGNPIVRKVQVKGGATEIEIAGS